MNARNRTRFSADSSRPAIGTRVSRAFIAAIHPLLADERARSLSIAQRAIPPSRVSSGAFHRSAG